MEFGSAVFGQVEAVIAAGLEEPKIYLAVVAVRMRREFLCIIKAVDGKYVSIVFGYEHPMFYVFDPFWFFVGAPFFPRRSAVFERRAPKCLHRFRVETVAEVEFCAFGAETTLAEISNDKLRT